MKKNTLRSLSLLLAVVLVFAGLPVAAFAEFGDPQPTAPFKTVLFGLDLEKEKDVVPVVTQKPEEPAVSFTVEYNESAENYEIVANGAGTFNVRFANEEIVIRSFLGDKNQYVWELYNADGNTWEPAPHAQVHAEAPVANVAIPAGEAAKVTFKAPGATEAVDVAPALAGPYELTEAGTWTFSYRGLEYVIVVANDGTHTGNLELDFLQDDAYIDIITTVNGIRRSVPVEIEPLEETVTTNENGYARFEAFIGIEYTLTAQLSVGGEVLEQEQKVTLTAENNTATVEFNFEVETDAPEALRGFDVYRYAEDGTPYAGEVKFYAVRHFDETEYQERHIVMNDVLGTFKVGPTGHRVLTQEEYQEVVNAASAIDGASDTIFAVRATGLEEGEGTTTTFVTLNKVNKAVVVVLDPINTQFKVRNILLEENKEPKADDVNILEIPVLDSEGNPVKDDEGNDIVKYYNTKALPGVTVNVHEDTSVNFVGGLKTWSEEPVETAVSGADGIAYIDNVATKQTINFADADFTNDDVNIKEIVKVLPNQLRAEIEGYRVELTESDKTQSTANYILRSADLEANEMTYYWIANEDAEGIIDRISGDSRYTTAIALAKALEAMPTVKAFETVILATGYNFPDALVANGLAEYYNAPILLTQRDRLNDDVLDFLQERDAIENVVIMGGNIAIDAAVEADLEAQGYKTTRIAGVDRYATSVKAFDALEKLRNEDINRVFLANGTKPYDALVASVPAAALGMPILLTEQNTLPTVVADKLTADVREVVVLGGTGAVSNEVYGAINVAVKQRLDGANRQLTSMKIADTFYADATKAYIVRDDDFADALVAARLASENNAAILLSDGDVVSQDLINYIKDSKITDITVIGGTLAISEDVVEQLEQVILTK